MSRSKIAERTLYAQGLVSTELQAPERISYTYAKWSQRWS